MDREEERVMRIVVTCADCRNGVWPRRERIRRRGELFLRYLHCKKIHAYVRADKDRCRCWHFEFRKAPLWQRAIDRAELMMQRLRGAIGRVKGGRTNERR